MIGNRSMIEKFKNSFSQEGPTIILKKSKLTISIIYQLEMLWEESNRKLYK